MHELKKKSEEAIDKVAIRATRWIGSTSSLVVHTLLFVVAFLLYFLGFKFEKILLVVTTIVSLEAIYLSIFIQMSVNRQASDLREVAEDVEEIQEDVDEIQKDVDEIQENVDEIQEDVEDIQEDVEEISEDATEESDNDHTNDAVMLSRIENTLSNLMKEIDAVKKNQK